MWNWRVVLNVTLWLFLLSFFSWLAYIWLPFSPPPVVHPRQDPCTKMAQLSLSGAGFAITLPAPGKSEYIGVSDGSFVFDTNRDTVNKDMKCQGAIQFRQGNNKEAGTDWTKAVVLQNSNGFQQEESNDAEALIYRENSGVLSSGLPYITFIVATILTGNDRGIGTDTLQGVYAAQEEFNRTHSDPRNHPLQIRLLIANFSSDVLEAPPVTGEQIEDNVTQTIIVLAKRLKVKGIILGLPFTFTSTFNRLDASGIPTTLSGAFSKSQLQHSSYIFPISASIEHEGQIGAQFVKQSFPTNKIALFVNPGSDYSRSLADAFVNAIGQGNILARETYTGRDIGPTGSITTGIRDALQQGANLIYFAGDLTDADAALSALPLNVNMKFMGGDALYELGNYTGRHYKSLYFTSSAFPDEWKQLYTQQPQSFPTIYRLLYSGWPLDRIYGYVRPDNNAILSNDALSVLLDASYIRFSSNSYSINFTPEQLSTTLRNTTFQGFSGRISFSGSDPNNKLVLVLHVTGIGLTQMVASYGCLLTRCKPV